MFEGRRVIVVVPAHNEEKLIGQVLDTMPAFVDRIIAVDDASTDGTAEVLAEASGRMGERLRVLRHPGNSGVGAAIIRDLEKQMSEDIPIWEHKLYHAKPLLCDGDGKFALYRRWMRQFFSEEW